MPPVEVGQDRGSRVGAQLGREFSIIQESDNSAAQGLAIMIRNNESVMQMVDTLGAASEGKRRVFQRACSSTTSPDDLGTRAGAQRKHQRARDNSGDLATCGVISR